MITDRLALSFGNSVRTVLKTNLKREYQMTPEEKYEVLKGFFGCGGIQNKPEKKDDPVISLTKKVHHLQRDGHLVHPKNFDQLEKIIDTIENKPWDKRTDEEQVMLANLISEISFFKHKRKFSFEDIKIMSNFIKYRRVETA